MPKVIHFEILADHPEKSAEFYKTNFGWEINKWDGPAPYWLIKSGKEDEPGIGGAIMNKPDFAPDQKSFLVIGVNDINAYSKRIEENGGTLTAESTPGNGATFRITLPIAD